MTLTELLQERSRTIADLPGDTSLEAATCRARVFLLRTLAKACLESCSVLPAHEIRSVISRLNHDVQSVGVSPNDLIGEAERTARLIRDFGVS